MKIAIGCDSAAFQLKEVIEKYLSNLGYEYEDMGTNSPDDETHYPLIAEKVATSIADGRFERGILLCGTGIGMCITANKIPGVYAALCHDVYSAERARKSNNAQIITMGARVVGPELAKTILKAWLESEFTPGPSSPKVALVEEIDRKYR
ncbi:ribose 5-phosphate isomerase B [Fonticella tunisiensis]|uniref:Ribose-5-phosphate isomerase n=1 Tax=Fonticella tunisiensis TaxID=1096341 RepID=A0A4R7K9S5_9CLOT|nr:ribose 5-phosphate isomerase B [Fonticella tunisiensis]TDT50351.1 ribose-5-phosphate isomerase [Fonticella tunisiensis]